MRLKRRAADLGGLQGIASQGIAPLADEIAALPASAPASSEASRPPSRRPRHPGPRLRDCPGPRRLRTVASVPFPTLEILGSVSVAEPNQVASHVLAVFRRPEVQAALAGDVRAPAHGGRQGPGGGGEGARGRWALPGLLRARAAEPSNGGPGPGGADRHGGRAPARSATGGARPVVGELENDSVHLGRIRAGQACPPAGPARTAPRGPRSPARDRGRRPWCPRPRRDRGWPASRPAARPAPPARRRRAPGYRRWRIRSNGCRAPRRAPRGNERGGSPCARRPAPWRRADGRGRWPPPPVAPHRCRDETATRSRRAAGPPRGASRPGVSSIRSAGPSLPLGTPEGVIR